jgi:hypothetical protein
MGGLVRSQALRGFGRWCMRVLGMVRDRPLSKRVAQELEVSELLVQTKPPWEYQRMLEDVEHHQSKEHNVSYMNDYRVLEITHLEFILALPTETRLTLPAVGW